MRRRTIKLYIMGDKYKNLKSIELSNWSGKAYIGNRKHVGILQEFDDLATLGVYFLISENEDCHQKKIYIGEADEINKRILDHQKKKDWWEEFVVFISKDSNLTKAHVRYLEKKLHDIAIQNKTTIDLDNSNTPPSSKLPISDCDDMDEFSENIIFVLKNLGMIDFTRINEDLKEKKIEIENPVVFELSVSGGKGTKSRIAKLSIEDSNYILLEGSYIRKEISNGFASHNYVKIRKQLELENYFIQSDDDAFLILNQNVPFTSPSAAGAIARNSSVNGRKEWKLKNGMTLDDYENSH